jgi:hypothetical protein
MRPGRQAVAQLFSCSSFSVILLHSSSHQFLNERNRKFLIEREMNGRFRSFVCGKFALMLRDDGRT